MGFSYKKVGVSLTTPAAPRVPLSLPWKKEWSEYRLFFHFRWVHYPTSKGGELISLLPIPPLAQDSFPSPDNYREKWEEFNLRLDWNLALLHLTGQDAKLFLKAFGKIWKVGIAHRIGDLRDRTQILGEHCLGPLQSNIVDPLPGTFVGQGF